MGRLSHPLSLPRQAPAPGPKAVGYLALLLLAACVPLAAQPPLLPYPGGFARGGLLEGRFAGALPGTPLFLDANEEALYAAYPYQLWVLRERGAESLPLPGLPRFLRASPKVAVGLGEAVWTEAGLFPYPAQDAAYGEALYWVGKGGLYRESALLQEGTFTQVVLWERRPVALGQGAYFPEGLHVPLPGRVRKAQAGACGVVALVGEWVYVVRPEGAKPLARAEDFAAWEDRVYLAPEGVVSCREVVWP